MTLSSLAARMEILCSINSSFGLFGQLKSVVGLNAKVATVDSIFECPSSSWTARRFFVLR